MENINWTFLFKHWVITLILGPIISQFIECFYNLSPHKIVALLEVYPISLIFSFIFSIPTYIVYAIIFYFLGKNRINVNIAKLIVISIAVIGVILTATTIKGSLSFDIAISYSIASIIAGFIFKLNFEKSTIN